MKWNIIDLAKNEILETVEGKWAADRLLMDYIRENPKRSYAIQMAGDKVKVKK